MSTFGSRLKELRNEFELKQDDLATKFHVHKATVSKWENGINFPDEETLVKLADMFDVSTDYLLGRTDKRKPNHLTKEDIIRVAPEYEQLLNEEGLEYVELFNEIKDNEIPPEVIRELIETILKYRHLNK